MKYFVLLVMASFSLISSAKKVKTTSPNIVYILADDLGCADLSCYGQTKFQTPHIDALAATGMKFSQHYTGSTVCAPSRSTLMTGLHTGHSPIRGNKELEVEGQTPMPGEYVTVAELLKTKGYTTGAFGKWGLGFIGSEGDAINQGFDTFFGYNCQRMAHRYYPPYLWSNDEKYPLEGNDWIHTVTYAPDVVQEKTLEFIEDNKDVPFFAYVPFIQPHAEMISKEDSIFKSFSGRWVEGPVKTTYASDYGPDIVTHHYCLQDEPYATFATMVTYMDNYVGEIVAKLKELGIYDNTIIMFASDNGPHQEGGHNPDFFNSTGLYRGHKRDLYDGGIRTPFIVTWPGKVEAGSTTDLVSAFWDFVPTVADIVDAKVKSTDGISYLPTLLQKGKQAQHDYLYWEFANKGGRVAVRMGDWKAVKYNVTKGSGKVEIYNIVTDPSERNNVAETHPELVEKAEALFVDAHKNNTVFPFEGLD